MLNTLYVVSPDAYLSLDNGNISVAFDDGRKTLVPLHTLEGIVCFSYKGATPALLGACRQNGIRASFYSQTGKYLCSVDAEDNGNVLLRRKQYRVADDEDRSVALSRSVITGKLYNEKFVLLRCGRDHELRVDTQRLRHAADMIHQMMKKAQDASSTDELRGIEGNAASVYFDVFDQLILQNKDIFRFDGRNRRPPTDPVNALLSFAYSLLANDCAAALHSVGLDPYVGFMHTDRPGRTSLALDLMEELRPVYADRFVLTLINNQMLNASDFENRESGAVLLTETARKVFFSEWQKKKKTEITHPFLDEKMPWGLVPYIQAQLLARTLRGDLDGYPPFFWK